MKQFVRFCLVGFSNVIVDFSIYIGLTRLASLNYLIANLIAAGFSICWSYYWNKNFTFQNKEKKFKTQFSKFFVVAAVGLALNEFFLYVFVSFGFYDILAKALAVGIVLFWNFFMNKFWVFKEKQIDDNYQIMEEAEQFNQKKF